MSRPFRPSQKVFHVWKNSHAMVKVSDRSLLESSFVKRRRRCGQMRGRRFESTGGVFAGIR